MNNVVYQILVYLLQVSVILLLTGSVYWLLLKKHTFYQFNRFLLITLILFSFAIPMVDVNISNYQAPEIAKVVVPLQEVTAEVPLIPQSYEAVDVSSESSGISGESSNSAMAGKEQEASVSPLTWLFLAYLVVALLLLVKLILSVTKVLRIQRSSRESAYAGFRLYVGDVRQPFSFLDGIYVNQQLLERADADIVLDHEAIHCQYRHTWDVLFFELVKVVLWIHPMCYLLARQSRVNNEYFTDQRIQTMEGVDPYTDALLQQYQLSKASAGSFSVVNNFAMLSLKQRILQMVKEPSGKIARFSYLTLLPLTLLLVGLFSCQIQDEVGIGRELRAATAIYHDEYGDQARRNGMILLDLKFDAQGRKKESFMRTKYRLYPNEFLELTSFIQWGALGDLLRFGKDWPDAVDRIYEYEVLEYQKDVQGWRPESQVTEERRVSNGIPITRIVEKKDRIISTRDMVPPYQFETDASGNVTNIYAVFYFAEDYVARLERLAIESPEKAASYRPYMDGEAHKDLSGHFKYDELSRVILHEKLNNGKVTGSATIRYTENDQIDRVTIFNEGQQQLRAWEFSYASNDRLLEVRAFNREDQLEYSVSYDYQFY